MKIYKRQIRPMVVPPVSRCINCKPYPLMPENYWCYEEEEEILKPLWELNAKKRENGMGRLEIEERYVEIEPPVTEIEHFDSGSTIILTFDSDVIDVDSMNQWVKLFEKAYPQCDIFAKIKGINLVKK